MNPLQGITILTAIATYGSYLWAVKSFFKIPESGMPPKMRLLAIPGFLSMIAGLGCIAWPANVKGVNAYLGLILFGSSLLLFWWAIRTNQRKPLNIAFTENQPSHLVQEGPYRFVRHPFYTSYILGWLAAPIASSQYWLTIPALVLAVLYYRAAKFEEGLFADSAQSTNYSAYRKRTGMFFPKLFRF